MYGTDYRITLKTRISPELYPFIYCLTILDVFYDASVGFYRCTLFHILFCTFYAAFIREFSRFTLLKSSYLYLYSAREILSSGIFATKCIVFPRLAHRPYTKESKIKKKPL